MQIDPQSNGTLVRFWAYRTLLIAASILMAMSGNGAKAGGGGGTKTQPIAVQFWLDYLHPLDGLPNLLLADRDPADASYPTLPPTTAYKDGLDYVTAKVGRDQNINFNLGSGYKKPAVRHVILNGGVLDVQPVPADCEPLGMAHTEARPALAKLISGGEFISGVGAVIPKIMGAIYGLNFDDTPRGVVRHVNAWLNFQDDAGKSWAIYFGPRKLYTTSDSEGYQYAPCGSCVLVERLENVNGKSRWRFATEGQPNTNPNTGLIEYVHRGYLYGYANTNPVTLILAGIVDLPLSGTIESLSDETEPSSTGYSIPDDPADCPLAH